MNTRRAYAIATGLFLCAAAWVRGANLASDVSTFSANVRNYNLVCTGNAAFTSSNDTQEGLAVQGNCSLDGNTLMSGGGTNFVSSSDPGLYVGGQLTLNGGSTKMNGSYACTPAASTGFSFGSSRFTAPSGFGGGILDSTNSSDSHASLCPNTNPAPSGWSWSTISSSCTAISADLATAPATGTITVNSQNLTFTPPTTLPSSGVVVFSLDCNLLGSNTYNGQVFSNVQINVPASCNYVINVVNGSGKTLFGGGVNCNSGSNNGQILWNICGSGTLNFGCNQFFGSVLAPSMSLATNSTIVNGQVATCGFSDSNAELHFTTFHCCGASTPAPVINPPLTAAGSLNEAFTYTISATNSPTSFGATGLPSWLSLNTTTGVITGTPTATGTFAPTITATNSGGTGSATLTITVSQTYTLTISGSPSAGGTFTGAGVYAPGTVVSVTESANSAYRTNGWGGTDGPSTASPTSASTTIVMSATRNLTAQFVQQGTVSVVASSGGTATGSGTFDASSNAPICATPNSGYRFNGWTNNGISNLVASPSTATTTVQVPASALTVTAAFTALTPPVFTSPNTLQVLVVGRAYSFTATATYAPTFSATGLPPGITMATSGVISGTATTVGSYTATLTATNSSGTATQSLPFIVYPVPVINPPLSVTGKLNEPFTYTITATGSPTSYNATGLPSWLSLNSTTGVLSGTPTATGTFTCTLLATNPGATGSATLTITVSQTYTLTMAGSPSAGGAFAGAGVYDPGTVVSISETANSGYRTNGWGGTDGPSTASPTSASTTIVMSTNRSLTAQFVEQFAITVSGSTGGTATGGGTYDLATVVPITATPSTGYRFVDWTTTTQERPASMTAASTTVSVFGPTALTAIFTPLTPPVFTSPNNLQVLVVGQPYSFTATATNSPTFSATGLPPGVTMASSGVISGTPTTLGSYTATLTATNSSGTATQSLPFIVYPVPVINPPLSVTGKLNEPFTYTITATGSPTSYGATGLPSWASVNASTGVITGTPTDTGTFTCTIFASNPAVSGSALLTITVSQTYTLTMAASPATGGTYTAGGIYDPGTVVSISETPNSNFRTLGWGGTDGPSTASPTSASTTIVMSANRSLVAQFIAQELLTVNAGAGGTVTGGGTFDQGSLAPITATPASGYRFTGWTGSSITNSAVASTTVSMTAPATVTANFAPLTPPVFTSPNNLQILVLGQPYTFTATATYAPTFSGVNLPPGITMASTGVISGTPTALGSYTATLTATNSSGSATQSLPFIVYPVPVINPPLFVPGKLNEPFSYTITATGSPTSYGAAGLPSWLSVDPATGIISGTPTATGTFTCTISASNPGATGSATLTITVSQTFSLTITGSPAAGGTFTTGGTYDAGAVVPITETANPGYRASGWGGPDGAATASPTSASTTILMWSNRTLVAQFIPQGVLTVVAGAGGTATGGGTFDQGSSATITAVPASGYQFAGWTGTGITNPSALSTTVAITAASQTVTANFTVLTPPVFTSPNNLQILVVGQPYTFTATATYSPTFSATGLPIGISMDPSGVISGTPTTVGSYSATLTATNSSGSATQNLPFIVYPVPVINPPLTVTGKLNEPFSYTITATGAPTSYGASGLPSWLTLDPATGIISGTPTATGAFTCTISASNPGATGSATLTINVSQTYTLTISGSPAAGGAFTGGGIYDPGTVVTITETANTGYRTGGWSGPDAGSTAAAGNPQTTIVMNANCTLVAGFVQQAVLTVNAGPGGTATGGGTYDLGASVPINATPSGANVFTGWTGDEVGNPNAAGTTVTITGDETVTAGFFEAPTTPEQLGTIIFPNAVASGQPGITPTTSTMPAVFVNNSDTPETVTSLTSTGDFQPTVALPFTIAPGQSYSIVMTFAPSALGLRTGVLTAVSNDPTNPVAQFNLQGTGVNPNQPPSATISAPATAYTGSPLTVTSTASAPLNNLTLHSVEWISASGTWTVNVANVSGGTSNRTVGITFPSTGTWTLRAGASTDNGVTWYYSPSIQVVVSNGTTNYTLETMAIPSASAMSWYTPSPVAQQTYEVQHINP